MTFFESAFVWSSFLVNMGESVKSLSLCLEGGVGFDGDCLKGILFITIRRCLVGVAEEGCGREVGREEELDGERKREGSGEEGGREEGRLDGDRRREEGRGGREGEREGERRREEGREGGGVRWREEEGREWGGKMD